jgi:hypothetical protein
MALPLERRCWTALAEIGQLIGQVHGTAYGCQRWNVKALQDLYTQILDIQAPINNICRPAAIEDLIHNGDPGPLMAMEEVVIGVLGEFGLFPEGAAELAMEEVGRVAADAAVGELRGYWEQVLEGVYNSYASSTTIRFNGGSRGELPLKQEVR